MLVSVCVDANDSTALFRWLCDDADSVNWGQVTRRPRSPRHDEMAVDLDLIQAVVGDATALGSLIVAILTWRSQRVRDERERVVRLERNGITVTVDSDDPQVIEHAFALLSEADSEDGRPDTRKPMPER